VRVELERPTDGHRPKRLWIGAFGRRVELGEFLVDGDKAALAASLRRLLGPQAAPRATSRDGLDGPRRS
jgi:hypothetical protein